MAKTLGFQPKNRGPIPLADICARRRSGVRSDKQDWKVQLLSCALAVVRPNSIGTPLLTERQEGRHLPRPFEFHINDHGEIGRRNEFKPHWTRVRVGSSPAGRKRGMQQLATVAKVGRRNGFKPHWTKVRVGSSPASRMAKRRKHSSTAEPIVVIDVMVVQFHLLPFSGDAL